MNNSTSIEQQSLIDLNAQLFLNIIVFDVLAPVTIISNLFVALFLFQGGRNFRSNYYIFLFHTTIVAIAQALNTFVMNGMVRTAKTLNNIPDNGSTLKCALIQLLSELTVVVDQYNILILAIDRLLAILLPFVYKKLGSSKIYVPGVISLIWFISFAITGAKFILFTKSFADSIISVCVISNSRPPAYTTFRFYHGLFLSGVTVIFYLAAIIVVKLKMVTSSNTQQLKKEIGFRLMVSSTTDGLIFTATYFISQAYLNFIAIRLTAKEKNMLTPLAFGFILLSGTPRFLVNYATNKDFRKVVKKYVGIKTNTVTTTITVQSVQVSTTKE